MNLFVLKIFELKDKENKNNFQCQISSNYTEDEMRQKYGKPTTYETICKK